MNANVNKNGRRSISGENMSEITEKLDEISGSVGEIKERLVANDIHIKQIIGPPHLEERMKTYADSKDEHKYRSLVDQVQNTFKLAEMGQENIRLKLEAELKATRTEVDTLKKQAEETEKSRVANHDENRKGQRKMEVRWAFVMGAAMAVDYLLTHFLK